MKINKYVFLVIICLFLFVSANAIPWPMDPQTTAHPAEKTYGDWNGFTVDTIYSMGYHGGIDIPADSGTPVYAVMDGVISQLRLGTGSDTGLLNIAVDTSNSLAWSYHHIHPDTVRFDIGDSVHVGDSLGCVARFQASNDDHLHFQRSNNKYTQLTSYCNPLDSLSPAPSQVPQLDYRPSPPPHHPYRIHYVNNESEDTTDSYETTYLRDSIDIIARAYTTVQGDPRCGVYAIGYGVDAKTSGGSMPFRKMVEMRDTINVTDSLKYYLTYADPSTPPYVSTDFHNWYIVTNCGDKLSPDSSGLANIEENCWPTKIDIAGTADADSIEDARFPDGYYVTTIKVWAHSGDSAVALDTVLVDNFNPKVKETRPSDWFAFVPTRENRIWCRFSEAMDTLTLDTTNIRIQSLKLDSLQYIITDIRYVQIDSLGIYELSLEVDSFRFKDTVQVQLLDGIRDLAGKSIESGSKQDSIVYSWTFIVGVMQLTDNDLNDLYPDVYHEKIVWTQAAAGSDIGEIMLYDYYGDSTTQISPGGSIHTIPYVYGDEVAWIGWQDTVSQYVYYYDGSSANQIAPANRARYSMEINDGGVVWRSYLGANGSWDSIWVEYYDPTVDSLYTLDLFVDFLGRSRGRVDIDADEIVWDGIDTTIVEYGKRELYHYSSGQTQNLSEDTAYNDGTPDISYGQIAWIKEKGGAAVWFFDGVGQRELPDPIPYSHSPYLHNGSTAWVDGISIPGFWYLYFYNGRDTVELMNRLSGYNNGAFHSLNIHNSQTVWVRLVYEDTLDNYRGDFNATLYDGENVIALTADTLGTGRSSRIETHDGFVVYDAWDGNDYEIYLYIGDTLFTPPAVAKNLRNEILETEYDSEKNTAELLATESDDKQASKKIQERKADERNDPQIRLIWSPNSEPDLDGYNIYRSENAYSYDTIPHGTVSGTDTIYLDTLPVIGANYYVITAFDNLNNESGFSNQTLADLTPDTIPPSVPANFAAVCDSPYQVANLSWDASPEPDLGMYKIYRADSSGGYSTPLDSVADSVTTYADSTIVQGMTYYYVATAVDTNNNESGYSDEDTVIVPDITPPSAPANFAASYDSIEQVVDLSWSASPEPDLGWYRIYRSETSGSYETPLDSVQEPTTTFVDSTILFDTTYYYVVTAIDTNNNESGYSNEDTVVVPDTTPPSPPTNLEAIYDSISQIVSLDWSAPSDPDVELYRVYRSMTSGSYGTPLDSISANDTTCLDSTITLGETFYYVVTAVDSSNNESNYSNEDTVDVQVRFMSYSSLASAYNNGFRMVRNSATDELFLSYAMSDSSALCTSTDDDGTTWSRSAFVGPGCFPSMALDSDTNVHCVFRGMVDMDFLGRSGGSRMSWHNAQDMQNNGFIAERASAGRTRRTNPESSTAGGLLGHRTLYYAVGYAWYSNNTWQNTSLYETQDSILSVCFAIDPLDTAWVVFNTYDSQDSNRLKIGKFYTQATPDSLESITNLDTYSSKGMTAIAIRSSDRSIWLVYERNGTIKCKNRDSTGTWNTRTVQGEGIYPTLSIGEAGSIIHFIWEKYYSETDRREIQTCYTDGQSWKKPQKIAQVKSENCYPFIEKGSIAVWHDLDYPYWDIFKSQRTESDTWTTPENISSTANDSKHPQVALYQSGSQTKFTYVWTEGDESPYEVKIEVDSSSSDFVPLYAFDLGQEDACLFSEKRDGHVKYGNGCEETADYDRNCLHYRITGLDPGKTYKLRLVSLQAETDALWRQAVEIDGCSALEVELGRNNVHAKDIILSKESYQDGAVDVRVRKVVGPKAVLSAMSVWEYEDGHVIVSSSGPQSSNNEPLGSILFGGIYPNPGREDTKIKLNAPYECDVSIRLYDVTGRMVDEIFNGPLTGCHEIPVVSKEAASGVYFVRVVAEDETITQKVILLR